MYAEGGNSHSGTLGPPWSACPLPVPVPALGLRKTTISYIRTALRSTQRMLTYIPSLKTLSPNLHNSDENNYPHFTGKETEAQRDAWFTSATE